MTPKTRRISLFTIRILLGVVFLLSGVGKLIDTGYVNYDLVRLLSTRFYWLIEYAAPIVVTISIIELVLALFLLWGRKLRGVFSIALAMILFFSGILGYFYMQGISVASCGCFGAFGIGGGIITSLIKNALLLILIIAGLLINRKNGKGRIQ